MRQSQSSQQRCAQFLNVTEGLRRGRRRHFELLKVLMIAMLLSSSDTDTRHLVEAISDSVTTVALSCYCHEIEVEMHDIVTVCAYYNKTQRNCMYVAR